MDDMQPDAAGNGRSEILQYHDGTSRRVFVTDVETPFPPGELIVSQTDLAGSITMCNEAFVHMSGYTLDELLGQPHHLLRHPDMPAAAFADLWNTVQEGRTWNGYVKNLRKDGGFYWVYATVVPKLRGGRTVGFTSVRREPSRRKVEAAQKHYDALRQGTAAEGGVR